MAVPSAHRETEAFDEETGPPTLPNPASVAASSVDNAEAATSDEMIARGPRPAVKLSQAALDAGNACIQCGLCLPACPTYLETGNEADSPRGRIRLMLSLHDGDIAHSPVGQSHLDRCLDCRSCETACPSGVGYHKLIEDARHKLGSNRLDGQPPVESLSKLQKRLFFDVLARPKRLRAALAAARTADRLGLRTAARKIGLLKLLGPMVKRMDALLPTDRSAPVWLRPLPAHSRAGGMDLVVKLLDPNQANAATQIKGVIGFFEGCVAQVMAGDVHRKATELMCAAGVDVVSPPRQVCCGAIHQHGGDVETARQLAKRNIDTYLLHGGPELSAIVTCTAGDGAMLRQYAELLADDPVYAERARQFSEKVRDISELLLELEIGGEAVPLRHPVPVTAAYHDACHLAHGQGVTAPPRQLLERIPGLTLVPLPESDICCGAAGTYNLTQPEMATALAERKLERFDETKAEVLVSGNIGCTMHLQAVAAERKVPLRIMHPVEILHAAAFGG